MNRMAELADWDGALLAGEIDVLKEIGVPLFHTGFSEEDIDKFLESAASAVGARQVDEAEFLKFQHTCPECGFQFDE